uniref:Uncharacterized protein n=1 Tax=Oryza meridionalis TaxID=40149 RepID=A0A0E0DHP8_9ORYZ
MPYAHAHQVTILQEILTTEDALTAATAGGTEATTALRSPTLLSRAPTFRSPLATPLPSLEALIGRGHLARRQQDRGGTTRKERETATEAGAIAALAWRS